MGRPNRPFRGPSVELERQIQPVYRALAGGIGSANLQEMAVMPLATAATTGGLVATMPGQIAWSFMSMSFASSATTQASTFTHGLGRKPEFFFNAFSNPFQLAFAPVSLGQWNSTQVVFALASDTVSNSFKVLLI